jgi:hypothetical protein
MAKFTVVDFVAGIMPWAGGLIPATMTYQNVQTNLNFGSVEALVIGGVVEGIGFVSITTALDLYEQFQIERDEKAENSWQKPSLPGQFWVAVAVSVVYLVAVLMVNALMDPGDIWRKLTMAVLSTFGAMGGVIVALRNQLGKRREAFERAEQERETEKARREREAYQEKMRAQREAEQERVRVAALQAERERLTLEHEQALKAQELKDKHEERMKKIEESSRKRDDKVSETYSKVTGDEKKVPETFGRWKDWRKLPENEKKVISGLKDAQEVSDRYGVSLKTGGNWLENARKKP